MAERSAWYSYGFVRQDLPGPVQTVQAGHAWTRAVLLTPLEHRALWSHCNFVLIGVADEPQLIEVSRVVRASVTSELFYEPDGDVGYTALATVPISGAQRELFQAYEILRS